MKIELRLNLLKFRLNLTQSYKCIFRSSHIRYGTHNKMYKQKMFFLNPVKSQMNYNILIFKIIILFWFSILSLATVWSQTTLDKIISNFETGPPIFICIYFFKKYSYLFLFWEIKRISTTSYHVLAIAIVFRECKTYSST
jgi:hypothetical protein